MNRRLAWVSIAVAVVAVAAAALVQPVAGHADQLTLFGQPFGQACPFLQTTGKPCASCGMTRAWVWAVRGELGRAVHYNAAGAALLAGIVTNGIVRAATLAGWTLPRRAWLLGVAGALGWIVLWMGSWAVRLAGHYPMP